MTVPLVAFLPAVATLAFFASALSSRLAPQRLAPGLALTGAAIALISAIAAGASLPFLPGGENADSHSAILFDTLSAVVLILISFVGFLVIQFSQRYLDGNARQHVFLSWLCATLAAISALVIADDVRIFVVAWIATSLSLHQLLIFYRKRPRAIIAARKKFIAARLGDVALIAAAMILSSAFETTSIRDMQAAAAAMQPSETAAWPLVLAPLMIAAAAILKSAQFPSHGWLIEVMETPTPVSALLHAGIVNAGGFLIIRFADVMILNGSAMHMLAMIGGFSALFGSVVMLTQTSIKTSLAYSTVAQMGFMLLQCGLGAFSAAALHLVAHSLYKAHAFLSSGRAVHLAKIPRPVISSQKRDAAIAFVAAIAIYASIGWFFGGDAGKQPAVVALGAIFIMGLSMYLSALLATPAGRLVGLGLAAGAAALYFALQNSAANLLRDVVPAPAAPDAAGWIVIALAVFSFGVVALAQIYQLPLFARLHRRFYVHASNGFYANAYLNRMIGALRIRTIA